MSTDQTAYTDQQLKEAEELAVFGGQHQIELQLGHVCNNRCVFCVSGFLTEEGIARQIPPEPVFQALEKGARDGVKRVTFLGGEPTVQRSFLPSVKLAVDLGYEEIVIFTNGVKTRKPSFIRKLREFGGNYEWRFSIQGGTEEAHDRVTMRKGSYQRITAGMRTLRDLGEDVTINMCVNEHSYRSTPGLVAICEEHGARQLHIDQIRPSDAGNRDDDYLRSIMARYSDMAPYFDEMMQRFEAIDPDYDVNLGNYPYCQLPRWAHKIHHDGQKTFTYPADGMGELSAPFDKYPNKRADKFHPRGCDGCVFRSECNGVFHKYAQLHGVEEFRAVSLEDLERLDTRNHFFVMRVSPYLEPLWGDAPPAPWRALETFRNTRDRVLEGRFIDGEGRRATLVLTPPDVQDPRAAPLWATERYNATLLLDTGVDAGQVVALVEALYGRLAAVDGNPVTVPPDVTRLALGLAPRERLDRGRRKLARLLHRIDGRPSYGGWRIAARKPGPGLGTTVRVEGPERQRVDLTLEVQPLEGRPLVAVRYELGDGTTAEAARPVVGELMAALRG